MTFFLVIDLVLRIFPFFSHIFRMFTMLNVVYDHFLTRKHNFSLCSCFHAHPTTLLLKILGDQCMGGPPTSNFGGPSPPVPPRSPPLPILRLVGFFPTSCSLHGLVLTSDPTFTKYELLFVLSSYLKYCHTSLSRFRPAINSRQAHFY